MTLRKTKKKTKNKIKDKNKQPTNTVTNLTWVEEIEQRNDEIFQLKNI